MFSIKHLALAAAALFALSAPAFAGEGLGEPFPVPAGTAQVFTSGAPRLDVGSEAYPSTVGEGADQASHAVNHVTRDRVPAYQRGFDVGSEAYPTPR